jgi:hypothetical protein
MTTETKTYVGVKIVEARPMTRGEYIHYRGWSTPAALDEDLAADGYLVEDHDPGVPHHDGANHDDPRHEGYVTWVPKKQFEDDWIMVE